MDWKNRNETKIIKIKYGKDYKTFSKVFNIKEYKVRNIEYIEFDTVIGGIKYILKQRKYHIKHRGRIITEIQEV